jgi:hypothetical protein
LEDTKVATGEAAATLNIVTIERDQLADQLLQYETKIDQLSNEILLLQENESNLRLQVCIML